MGTDDPRDVERTGSSGAVEHDGDMGVSSERVGPVAGGRGTIGTEPTYDDPAARPRSTGPNGSVPAPEEPIAGLPPD